MNPKQGKRNSKLVIFTALKRSENMWLVFWNKEANRRKRLLRLVLNSRFSVAYPHKY